MEGQIPSKKSHTWLWIIAAIIVIFFLSRCVGSVRDIQKSVNTKYDLEITSKDYEKHDEYMLITGEITNTSATSYDKVKVYGYVYDKNGNQVGADYSYTDSSSLAPNGKTTFSVYIDCNGREVDKYKVSLTDD